MMHFGAASNVICEAGEFEIAVFELLDMRMRCIVIE